MQNRTPEPGCRQWLWRRWHSSRQGHSESVQPGNTKAGPHQDLCVLRIQKTQPPYLDLVPMIKRLFDAFGPDRLMWASDCPYQLTAPSTYAAPIAIVRHRLDFVSADDRRKLLRTTAESKFFFTVKK
ncbi:MAG: amidohydrolase family protein [Planctomycetales bacterium]|nr:amidohydrolase family protein [Planctomycetales bacterium]